jgi:hypothetical protein
MTIDAPLPIVLRIFEPVALVFPEGARMPSTAVASPPCLLCQSNSRLPPSRLGFISTGEEERLFLICDACGWDLSDNEVERRILELVTAPADNRILVAST